jgi:hypothetical protein
LLNLRLWHVALGVVVLLFLGGFVGGRIGILIGLIRANERIRTEGRKHALEEAEEEILEQSPKEWAEMHVHLLQSLEDQAAPGEYRQALEAIREAIDLRLERGVWKAGQLRFPDDGSGRDGVSREELP